MAGKCHATLLIANVNQDVWEQKVILTTKQISNCKTTQCEMTEMSEGLIYCKKRTKKKRILLTVWYKEPC